MFLISIFSFFACEEGAMCSAMCENTVSYTFTEPLATYSVSVSSSTILGSDTLDVLVEDGYQTAYSEISSISIVFTSDGFDLISENEIDVDTIEIQINDTEVIGTDEISDTVEKCTMVCMEHSYTLNTDDIE
jgi:hypothetical protein